MEINVSREKALSYNKYIINGLKNHSDYFLTDKETKEIKELLLGNFQKIKDYLVKYLFTDAEEEAGKLYDIVKSINEKYLGESLGNRVINFYNNITFIHQIINNYYKDISEKLIKNLILLLLMNIIINIKINMLQNQKKQQIKH